MTETNYSNCIFVVGCARSGTTLMASILQMSPEIAEYRAETKLLDGCREKYGDLANSAAKARFLKDWLRSRQFVRSGLSRITCEEIVREESTYIGVLSKFMNLVAAKQGKLRWVDSTPTYGYCLDQIGATFPNATMIHMIRDGRAVAASLAKLGWAGVATDNFDTALQYSALKWKHATEAIMKSRKGLGRRYIEVSYEELVSKPLDLLPRIFEKLNLSDVNFEDAVDGSAKDSESQKSSLSRANSPYRDVSKGISDLPATRWSQVLSTSQITSIELVCFDLLTRLGYQSIGSSQYEIKQRLLAVVRPLRMDAKRWLKCHTLLGRLSQSPLEVGAD